MNATRLAIVFILGSGLLAGVGMSYLYLYAGWSELTAEEVGPIEVRTASGALDALDVTDVSGLDTVDDGVRLSGALSFRACFTTAAAPSTLAETYVTQENAVPLTSPRWFDCYDAREVGASLENGTAVAFAGEENISYGVDRVVAVLDDGRGFVWHQLNACGEALFAGDTPPETCPEPPAVEE